MSKEGNFMKYATLKRHDVANGPGVRVSLFVSGCRHHCRGCFNPETWDFNYGKPFDGEVLDTLLRACNHDFITGLSVLGGEPFEPENQPEVLNVMRKFKELYPQKTVWCYTGYDFEKDILTGKLGPWEITEEILSLIDVLVDGEFKLEEKDLNLRFRGSCNQRVINVPESLKTDTVVLWDEGEGMLEPDK